MRNVVALLLGIGLVAGSLLMIERGRSDVEVFGSVLAGMPATFYHPGERALGTVLVAHGFAGSRELMRPWGLALARRGFIVVVLDLPGHGRNTDPMPGMGRAETATPPPGGIRAHPLAPALHSAIEALEAARQVPGGRLGLVGDSMGAGAVAAVAAADARVAGAVAVSGGIDPAAPPPANMLFLLAERDLPGLAERLARMEPRLGEQFPDGQAFQARDARAAVTIPGRNHITILYDAGAHDLAARWLALAMGRSESFVGPQRPEGWGWVLLGLVGAGVAFAGVAGAMAPLRELPPPMRGRTRGPARVSPLLFFLLMCVAAIAAVLASQWVNPLAGLPLLVADRLLSYFLAAALVTVLARVALPDDFNTLESTPVPETLAAAGTGLAAGAAALVLMGPVIQAGLSNFVPTAPRLLWLPLLVLLLWPYFIQEEAVRAGVAGAEGDRAGTARLVAALGKVVVTGTLVASALLPGGGGFLPIMAPVAGGALLMTEAVAYVLDLSGHRPAAAAAAKCIITAWLMLVAFPMA